MDENFLFLPRALAAAIADIAFATLIGSIAASRWLCASDTSLRDRLRRAAVLSAVLLLLAFCVQGYLLTATMAVSAGSEAVWEQLAAVLTGTHAGRMQTALVGTCVLLILLVPFHSVWSAHFGSIALSAGLILLTALRAATGHAAGDGDFTLAEFVQFSHLASIAVWSGGVMTSAFLVPAMLRGNLDHAGPFLRRLSAAATIAVVVVIATGVYNSWHGLGGAAAPLAHTQWGFVLDIKALLVCIAMVLGTCNRRLLHSSERAAAVSASRLAKLLRAEAAVMLLILCISAVLANSPPPQ